MVSFHYVRGRMISGTLYHWEGEVGCSEGIESEGRNGLELLSKEKLVTCNFATQASTAVAD